MNRKIIAFGLISMMLIAALPISATAVDTDEQADFLEKENFSETKEVNSDEDINLVLENPGETVLQTGSDSTGGKGHMAGWLTIQTKGKGFKIFLPINLLGIAHPMSALQYPELNPFGMEYYFGYIVYNDPNATTKITKRNGETKWINGSHSLFTTFFNSRSLSQVGMLFNDGLIDGLGGPQIPVHLLAAILSGIWNSLIPSAPLFDFTRLHNFTSTFQSWPLYFPSNFDPLFDTPFLNEIQKFPLPIISNLSGMLGLGIEDIGDISGLVTKMMIFAFGSILFQYLIVNRFTPFLCPLISFIEAYGWGFTPGPSYSLFVGYNENPNPKILDGVQSVQDRIQNGMLKIDRLLENMFGRFLENDA
ncbi:MAG: hypothetical protein V5A64_01985 [Candidatus Thermoplasmatota archaeon]